ncbi:MAG: tRNA 2-thiocytidine(32) synthetase TtcA [Ruminococcaceae bacterium]|nr:tRNA 2-thiocytidine(32) synthetase TtcA [Oscillospiraceae bacterium]
MQKVLSYVRRAVDDYHMIEEGDKIAVGVSGGKDSVTLALALHALSRFYPKKFEVVPITLSLGFDTMDFAPLAAYFEAQGLPLIIKETNIAEILFDIRREPNPCSLCAKLRRGALHDEAIEAGCRKVALGHHNDDALETFILCLFYEGRLHSFSPVTYLDRKDIHLIRPMLYMQEADVVGFIKRSGAPVVHNPCPANGYTKRQYAKELLAELSRENRGLKERIFTAMTNGLENYRKDEMK